MPKPAAALAPDPGATDHVDLEDGTSAGASIEPEGAEAAAPEVPVVDEAAIAAAAAVAPVKTVSEQTREDIYAKVRDRRQAEVTEAQTDPQVKILDTFAGGEDPAATPDSTPTDVAAPAAEPAVAAAAPPAGGDPAVAGIKISVYGQEQTVSEDEVREAGIRALQKQHAGEYRLSEAAKQEQKLRKFHKELDDYRASLVAMETDLRAGKLPAQKDVTTAAAPPSTDAPAAVVDKTKIAAAAKAFADVVYKGDPDATAKALEALLADVAQGRTATPPPVDTKAVAEAAADVVDKRNETRTIDQKRQEVNTTFATEFASLAGNPEAFAVAQTRFNALLETRGETDSWVTLAREAGNVALDRYPELRIAGEQRTDPPAIPAKPAAPAAPDALAERRLLKSKTVPRQPTASARATPPPPAALPSNKDYIASMRAARGLPPS